MKRRNMQIAGEATVERNTVEVAKAVEAMKKVNPQAVVMVSAYKSCAAFIREMKKADLQPSFWNVSFVGSKALAKELGAEGRGVQISQVVPFPWDNGVAVVKEYRKLIAAEGKEPNFSSLEGFISAKVMVEGLRRAGKNPTRESIIRALATMDPSGAWRIASAQAKSLPRFASARSSMSRWMRSSSSFTPPCRNAAGSCCSNPMVPPSARSSPA